MHITHATRVRFGLNSPISAVEFGTMHPRPMPATSRSHRSCWSFCANAVAIVIREKKNVAYTSTGRRPILSASMLNTIAPIMTPRWPAEMMYPICCVATFHSALIAGLRYPMA